MCSHYIEVDGDSKKERLVDWIEQNLFLSKREACESRMTSVKGKDDHLSPKATRP